MLPGEHWEFQSLELYNNTSTRDVSANSPTMLARIALALYIDGRVAYYSTVKQNLGERKMPKSQKIETELSLEVRDITNRMREAIRNVLEGTGYELRSSNAKYSDDGILDMNVKTFNSTRTGETLTLGERDWNRFADYKNLPDVLGKLILIAGATYRVQGYKPRSFKRPVMLMDSVTGSRKAAPIDTVRNAKVVG